MLREKQGRAGGAAWTRRSQALLFVPVVSRGPTAPACALATTLPPELPRGQQMVVTWRGSRGESAA